MNSLNSKFKLVCSLSFLFILLGCQPDKASKETTQEAYAWEIPDGFPKPAVPKANPMSDAKVELGRFLFYDKSLSANQKQSCATCHIQSLAFAEPKVTSTGSTGQHHRRNSPALVNIAYNKTLTWSHDGITTLERQILLPIFGDNPIELGVSGNEQMVLSRFKRAPYPKLFDAAFASQNVKPTFTNITQALSSFVRSLISLDTKFDKYAYQQQDEALTPDELVGMNLFFSERLECHHCHGGFNFTQSTTHEKQPLDRRPFHNTGLYYTERPDFVLTQLDQQGVSKGYPQVDTGLAEVSGNFLDDGRFRAPTLRNIALTAPYMHDGSIATLEEVIDVYAAGGRNITSGKYPGDGRLHPLKSPFVKGFELTKKEKEQLIEFLHTLTDLNFIQNPKHKNPWH
ncbi:di-heme enzyme [Parashewanella spongiae]|uniref:Di-heme enzyme n=1 Tax=Parashewanella spongiae TaxID=342950 RepID=A0A3A6TJN8_9GAMM|nr:MbnH family di-heme enzyme [Parashewanella spongiae]MCL1079236.1 di-heme enzyme [Parashewanella spongiae]RJY11079.1 di-heme enzyme [Parashewanella spongiae]